MVVEKGCAEVEGRDRADVLGIEEAQSERRRYEGRGRAAMMGLVDMDAGRASFSLAAALLRTKKDTGHVTGPLQCRSRCAACTRPRCWLVYATRLMRSATRSAHRPPVLYLYMPERRVFSHRIFSSSLSQATVAKVHQRTGLFRSRSRRNHNSVPCNHDVPTIITWWPSIPSVCGPTRQRKPFRELRRQIECAKARPSMYETCSTGASQ